jgi:hypothetical protein
MLDGAVWHGTVDGSVTDNGVASAPGQMLGDNKQIYFESNDGKQSGMIEMDAVKAIYVGTEVGSEIRPGPRFFDCAPIPSSLWVRTAFVDGEVVEGMIANAWSAFSAAVIRLHLPGQRIDQSEVLIPRTSIAELQVITTR